MVSLSLQYVFERRPGSSQAHSSIPALLEWSIPMSSASSQLSTVSSELVHELPNIVWRGVALRPGSSLEYTSRTVHGVGLVPPALFGQNLTGVRQAESNFTNQTRPLSNGQKLRLDKRGEAVYHSLRQSSADSMFTSWSRSWTYALFYALQKSRSVAHGLSLQTLMEKTFLIGALPRRLGSKAFDLMTLLRSKGPQDYIRLVTARNPNPPNARELQDQILTMMQHSAEAEQEVVIFGHIPEEAYFTISLWQLLKANGVFHLPPSYLASLPVDLKPKFYLQARHNLCVAIASSLNNPAALSSPNEVAARWIRSTSGGRFCVVRQGGKEEDAQILDTLRRAMQEFVAQCSRQDWSRPAPGEVCW